MNLLSQIASFLEKQDLLSKLTESEKLHDFGYSDIHVIAAIADMDHANVTRIAEQMHMTRSAISKITKRLIARSCIICYTEDYNKKEKYFHLSDLGEQLNTEHEKRHQLWLDRDERFLNAYSKEEQAFLQQFMTDYNAYLEEKIKELEGEQHAD